MRLDQEFNIIPRGGIEILNRKVALGEGAALQQVARVRQECTVDERQTNVAGLYQRLADARAYRTAAGAIEVHDAVAANLHGGCRRSDRHYVVNFEYNVQPILWGWL